MIDYIEIRDQIHQMSGEGTADTEPSVIDIESAARVRGYVATNVEIFFDDMQKMWRFGFDIKPLEESERL